MKEIPDPETFDRWLDMWQVTRASEAFRAATAQLTAAQAETERLRAALSRIEKWSGEFPETGRFWDDGTPMSYSAAYGSNGERDYMRSVARAALVEGGVAQAENTRLRQALTAIRDNAADPETVLANVDAALTGGTDAG